MHEHVSTSVSQPGNLCLVGIEPASNSMVLAQLAQTRTQDTWQALMEQALADFNGTVMQSLRVRFPDACFVSSSPNA